MEEPRIGRSARRHKIGSVHLRAALAEAGEPEAVDGDAMLFIGTDDRGIELEIVVVPDDRHSGGWTVIHVMPTGLRRKR